MTPKIVLNVSGGVVQEVFGSPSDAEIVCVDWDTEGCDPARDGTFEIVNDNGRTQQAAVIQHHVFPLEELSGMDVGKALEKAGLGQWLKEPPKIETGRYILYDFDADDLATTNVYDDHAEAVEDASQLDNVIVMPLVFEQQTPAGPEDECDCEKPGYFCSGVPGILAHIESGRLAPGAKVERCDLCRRYPSDEAAAEKLRELGHDRP